MLGRGFSPCSCPAPGSPAWLPRVVQSLVPVGGKATLFVRLGLALLDGCVKTPHARSVPSLGFRGPFCTVPALRGALTLVFRVKRAKAFKNNIVKWNFPTDRRRKRRALGRLGLGGVTVNNEHILVPCSPLGSSALELHQRGTGWFLVLWCLSEGC